MILFVDAVKPGANPALLDCYMPDYETAFDRLNQLVTEGWSLEYAVVVDEGDCLCLPVEAFDGQPIQRHILSLQQQWTQLLASYPTGSRRLLTPQSKKAYLLDLDAYYNRLLTHLEKMIILLLIRKRKALKTSNKKMSEWLCSQYDLRLKTNQRMRQQTQQNRRKNSQRIRELENQL